MSDLTSDMSKSVLSLVRSHVRSHVEFFAICLKKRVEPAPTNFFIKKSELSRLNPFFLGHFFLSKLKNIGQKSGVR